jgi:hypothetical protein
MRRMSVPELMEFVIARPSLMKAVCLELRRRPMPPDPVAGETLVRAYQACRADAWLTAFFLVEMRARGGYDAGREILHGVPGLCIGWTATTAMVLHDPVAAGADFREILCDGTAHPLRRRCAARGLNPLNDPSIVPTVLQAVRAGHLGAAALGSLDADLLVNWLAESGGGVANLAFDVIRRRSVFDPMLARATLAALDAGRVEASPVEREKFAQRMARLEAWWAKRGTDSTDP